LQPHTPQGSDQIRQAFSKRKKGLVLKAFQLNALTDAKVGGCGAAALPGADLVIRAAWPPLTCPPHPNPCPQVFMFIVNDKGTSWAYATPGYADSLNHDILKDLRTLANVPDSAKLITEVRARAPSTPPHAVPLLCQYSLLHRDSVAVGARTAGLGAASTAPPAAKPSMLTAHLLSAVACNR
jgi:hypothetical protein